MSSAAKPTQRRPSDPERFALVSKFFILRKLASYTGRPALRLDQQEM